MIELGFYKIVEGAVIPKIMTAQSACFDISAVLDGSLEIQGLGSNFEPTLYPVVGNTVTMPSGHAVKIPTGLIADIPVNQVMKIYIRSSIAYKKGLTLVNSVGVIDSDYVDPIFILLRNSTKNNVKLEHGERIAQGQLEQLYPTKTFELLTPPRQKTDRTGGIGSTNAK